MKRILLTTTSYQDTPGPHHDKLTASGWEIIRERGPLPESRMLELVGDIDGMICGDDAITEAVLDKALPRLEVISKYGIGLDKIDVPAATERGIPVLFTPGVNHTTVSEHTFTLLLSLYRNLVDEANHTRNGEWKRVTGHELLDKRIAIIGLGRIGKEVAIRARAFGMKAVGYDIYWDEAFAAKHGVERAESIEAAMQDADVVTLHTFLSPDTEHMICAESIAKMKDGVIILNCARGELVKADDMVDALKSGKVGGYGTDVLDQEPPPPDHPLLSAPNCVVTPHIGSRTYESVQRQAGMATDNLMLYLDGKQPLAVANQPKGKDHLWAKPAPAKEEFYIVPEAQHNELIEAAYKNRGYTSEEAVAGARFCATASTHGIRTHNGIKALHLDHLFGSGAGGCVPAAEIEKMPSRFEASQVWNANKKLGQAVAYEAMETCIELADKYGIGMVSVDQAFHYLWGGGYVIDAAKRGYIAYTNCTAALAEVVPFMGKYATLGTNPHSWAFPTTDAVGYPIVIDWATSTVAMGRVQQFAREGKPLPPNCAVDKDGNMTTDPTQVKALLPFGAHKGYGLSLVNELMAAMIGGSLPTLRSRPDDSGDKHTPCFFFQVIHPDAINSGAFARGRNQAENLKAVIDDILGHGNEKCMLPGQIEAEGAARTAKAGGLLFSKAEIEAFNELARECGAAEWSLDSFKVFEG